MAGDSIKKKLITENAAINSSEILNGDFCVVGRVKDAHGLKGEIWVVLFAGQADWQESLKNTGGYLLTESDVPLKNIDIKNLDLKVGSEAHDQKNHQDIREFHLKGVRTHKNGIILDSLEVRDRTGAEGLRGYFLQIPQSYLSAEVGEAYFLAEFLGFQVCDQVGLVGEVVGFSSNGAQDLLVVDLDSSSDRFSQLGAVIQVEIPFVEAFVRGIKMNERRVIFDLPEGMIDVQLGLDDSPDDGDE